MYEVSETTALGQVHKVRHARGGWGPRRCHSLWKGGGSKSMWRQTLKKS